MTTTTDSILAPEHLFPALRTVLSATDRVTTTHVTAPLTHDLKGGTR